MGSFRRLDCTGIIETNRPQWSKLIQRSCIPVFYCTGSSSALCSSPLARRDLTAVLLPWSQHSVELMGGSQGLMKCSRAPTAPARGLAICLGNFTSIQTQFSPSSQGEIPFRSVHFGTHNYSDVVQAFCSFCWAGVCGVEPAFTPAVVTPLQPGKGNWDLNGENFAANKKRWKHEKKQGLFVLIFSAASLTEQGRVWCKIF